MLLGLSQIPDSSVVDNVTMAISFSILMAMILGLSLEASAQPEETEMSIPSNVTGHGSYNVDEIRTERHSFTIGAPYKVDIDAGFAENGNTTFTANQAGVFTFYCKYHLPVMAD